ncbi:hypothetical protein PBY51_000672 [Eleginops maclovinus]|uniref:Uncharacterized protein n=1 Tax=Eleginops maclovinus TaxID=56733 RepID=A0AAN7XHY7_ELEMC|nr:hypothetical protein PBY51_000672 [Eleginops maclovinus]
MLVVRPSNLSSEAKSLRSCFLESAANAFTRQSIAAYPSGVNTGKCALQPLGNKADHRILQSGGEGAQR